MSYTNRNNDQATRDKNSPLLFYTKEEWIRLAEERIKAAAKLSGPAQPEIMRAWEYVKKIQEKE
jgi:hypothetical protein